MMEDLNLQVLTLQGLETYFGPRGASSTIDLVLASEGLLDNFIKCKTLDIQHGSDHQAVENHFNIEIPQFKEFSRSLYKSAPWDKIQNRVKLNVNGLTMQAENV